MKAQIYVNRHVMAANKKATKETGELVDKKAIAVNTYKGSIYCKEVEFTTGARLIQNAETTRCSGATVWIEVDDFESLVIDGIKGDHYMFEKNEKINMIKNQELAETAIREARKTIEYNTVEYPIEYFTDKISQQQIVNNLQWNESKQSYFIESLMLGLPVLNIVFNDVDDNNDGSELEEAIQLIDGKQRLYTALNFIDGNLRLENLKQLTALNGFIFKDLPLSRQRRFQRITVKAIAVAPNSDKSIWSTYK